MTGPRRRSLVGYALLLPAVLPVAGLLVYAVAWDVVISLTGVPDRATFPDLQHYRHLASDPEVWQAARNTLALVVTTTAAQLVVGVLTALLLWRPFWGRAFVFFSVFVPWAFPATFSAFAWYWMLIPPFHTFYTVGLQSLRFGLDDALGAGAWQVLSVAIMSVWRGSSIIAVFLLAGLNAIPDELLDVGRLEASSVWQFFCRVVTPLSRRMLVLAMLVALVVTSIEYSSMYVETGGRVTVPVLGTLAYRESVQSNHPELGAALGLVQIPFGIALAFLCLRLLRDPAARRPAPTVARDPGSTEAVAPRRTQRARLLPSGIRRALLHAAGACAALAAMAFHLAPVYYTAVQAFRSVREYARGNPFWVYEPTFEDVREVLDNPVLWRWAWNTFVVFGAVLLVGLTVSFLAGYALARLRVRAGRALAALMVLGYVVPPTAVVAPVYGMFARAGLDDTRISLELLYLTLAVPFATWLFYAYFDGLSRDVEDHARLDGGGVRVILRVVLPMSWPVVAAAALFAIGMMASDVLYTSTFALTDGAKTLPGGLGLNAIELDEWASANAAVLLASLPLVGICAVLSPYYVRGLRSALFEGA